MIKIKYHSRGRDYEIECKTQEQAMTLVKQFSYGVTATHYVYADGELVAIAKDGELFGKIEY